MTQPLAYIHPEAIIAQNVVVEPFTTIDKDVEIGEGTWIGPNVTIMAGARIGKNCKVFPGAVIAAQPQDLKFAGEKTTVHIGDNTVIRECVTVNRGTVDRLKTVVGSNCLLMAYVHIAHDCIIGNNCILANTVQVAGHVEVGDYAIIGGSSAIHQFVRVGQHAMISGGSLIRKDVPPFVKDGPRTAQLRGYQQHRAAPARLFGSEDFRDSAALPPAVHERPQQRRRPRTNRAGTGPLPRARRSGELHPQLRPRRD